MRPAAGTVCHESGWCDYSAEHRRVREEAEKLVRSYVEGRQKEYWMTVIVAPYGSGKTTLLRHLLHYAKGLGVEASHIEFADLVNYIVERYGTVHESRLPGIVEEYAREKLGASGDTVFVLLVDEIEESYDLFRGVVEHETSPLRGLAEAVRTHSTWVYPVLAFGPSSTLKEAIFGPVAWRSRVLTIPLIPKPVIRSMIELSVDDNLLELAANTVWWASKGRAAWVNMLVEQLVPRLIEAAGKGPEALEALLLGDEALAMEIVEGVPLFDRSGYRDVKRFVENKRLLPYLAAFVGPVPISLLERLIGDTVVPEAGLVYGFTRSMIRAEELLGETSGWMERIARSKGLGAASVEHAMAALEHVVQAWSRGGMLPFDPQGLRELFSIAADLAREIYGDDPAAAQLLESINPDLVVPEVVRGEEVVAYLRPSMLTRLYPSASSNPLVGCARKAGPSQVVDVVESLAPEELVRFSEAVARLLGLEELLSKYGARLVIAPAKLLQALGPSLCRGRTVLVAASADEEGQGRLPAWLRSLEALGLTAVAAAGPRLSVFLYSLLYSQALGTPSCSLEKLDPHDRRLMSLYSENLKTLVVEKLHELAASRLSDIEKAVERLKSRYGRVGVAAAARLAEKGAAAIERAGEALKRIDSILAELAHIASMPRPRVPELTEAAQSIIRLEVLPHMEALPGSCLESLPEDLRLFREVGGETPSLTELLLSLREASRMEGGAEAVERAAALVKELEAALRDLASLEPLAAEAAAEAVREFVEALVSRLKTLEERLISVEERLKALPEPLASRAVEAFRADIARIGSLEELAAYLGAAAAAAEELAAYARRLDALEEIEAKRKRITAMIEAMLSEGSTEGNTSAQAFSTA